jgi:hypothetical protein
MLARSDTQLQAERAKIKDNVMVKNQFLFGTSIKVPNQWIKEKKKED